MSGRCIMMCAGKYHPMEIRIRPDDFVIAVDGGLSGLIRQGIRPDFLLGDFDSLRPGDTEIMKRYREMGESSFLQLPVEKDDTDTMAAAKLGIEKGYTEFLIYVAPGWITLWPIFRPSHGSFGTAGRDGSWTARRL